MRGKDRQMARMRAQIAAEHASEGQAASCAQDYRVQPHSGGGNSFRVGIPQLAIRNFDIDAGTTLRPFVDFKTGALIYIPLYDLKGEEEESEGVDEHTAGGQTAIADGGRE